jgi:hypothetical protein
VSLNSLLLLAISMWFRSQVETIVARHTTGLIGAVMGRHDQAERMAEDARRAVITLNSALHGLEFKHDGLEARVRKLEEAVP